MTPTQRPAPPLMDRADRRKLLQAPIIITVHGGSRHTWGGVAIADTTGPSGMCHRSGFDDPNTKQEED